MKVAKPTKIPILSRVVEVASRPRFHVAAMIGFDLESPTTIADEMTFWATVQSALGELGVVDEVATKRRGECLVAGAFHAPGGVPTGASHVRVRVGSFEKRLAVVGDRVWQGAVPTAPKPMTTMPIDWPHAFGGPGFDQNPHGKGAAPVVVSEGKVHPLPNVEHYGRLIRSPSDRPAPAGLMPMDVSFPQRRARAGTYDKQWFQTHFPGLPSDLDVEFFNVAPEDQWIEGTWQGDESVLVEHMHPSKPLIEGRLPGLVVRSFVTRAAPDGEPFVEMPLRCDTVWLFPASAFGVVVFHGSLAVTTDDAADIRHLVVGCEQSGRPKPPEHYQQALERRLDKDEGALAGLSDSDLMPSSESGVAPNIGEFDIGGWVKSENLAAAKLRRGAERKRSEIRAQVEAEGLDPKAYGLDGPLPPEPAPPPDDIDALVAYMKEQQEQAAKIEAQGEQEEAHAKERARQAYAEIGLCYDDEIEKGLREHAGPPKSSARAQHLQALEELRRAGAEGVDLEALDRRLRDPRHLAMLEEQEQEALQAYRSTAHLQPSPHIMPPGLSAQARVVAQAALDSGESLADRDFTGVDWSGMKLAGIDLRGAFLEASNLEGCDLSGANLERAVLAKANLQGAVLRGAKLAGANLGAALLGGAVLDGADMTDAVLGRASLGGASFKDAKLAGADLLLTKFERADLSGARLPGANILNSDLSGCRFVGADLSESNLVECTLDGADFSRATLHKTTLVTCKGQGTLFRAASFKQGIVVHGSELPGADLSDADLERANLRGTVLTGARLDRANLAGGDISECDCTGASLERVVLEGGMAIRATLTRSSLRGARLVDVLMSKAEVRGADFTGANLARADLSRVLGDGATSFAEAEVAQVRFLPKAPPPPEGGVS